MEEFGIKCSYKYCRIKDFLPFKCNLCKQEYCLEHSKQSEHECNKTPIEQKAMVCPVCNQTIPYQQGKNNPDLIMTIHLEQDCSGKAIKPNNYICKICSTKLHWINKYSCEFCFDSLCSKHRLPEQHNCKISPSERAIKSNQKNHSQEEQFLNGNANNPGNKSQSLNNEYILLGIIVFVMIILYLMKI